MTETPNKTLPTNRRPGLGFGLSARVFGVGLPRHVFDLAAVSELSRHAPPLISPFSTSAARSSLARAMTLARSVAEA